MSAASRQVQAAGKQAVQRGCAATGHVIVIGRQACLRAAAAQRSSSAAACRKHRPAEPIFISQRFPHISSFIASSRLRPSDPLFFWNEGVSFLVFAGTGHKIGRERGRERAITCEKKFILLERGLVLVP